MNAIYLYMCHNLKILCIRNALKLIKEFCFNIINFLISKDIFINEKQNQFKTTHTHEEEEEEIEDV